MYFVTHQPFRHEDFLLFRERINKRVGREAIPEDPDGDEMWDCFRQEFVDHLPSDIHYALESACFFALPSDTLDHLPDCGPPIEYRVVSQDELIQLVREDLPESRGFSLDELTEHLEDEDDETLISKCKIAEQFEADLLGDAWREARRAYFDGGYYGSNLELHARYVSRHVYQLEHRLALAGQGFDFVKREVVDFEDHLITTAVNDARAIRLTDKLRSSYCAKDDDGDPTYEMEDWLNENCPDWRLELNTQGENYFVFSQDQDAFGFKLKWV